MHVTDKAGQGAKSQRSRFADESDGSPGAEERQVPGLNPSTPSNESAEVASPASPDNLIPALRSVRIVVDCSVLACQLVSRALSPLPLPVTQPRHRPRPCRLRRAPGAA